MAFSPKVYNFALSSELADSVMCWGLDKFKVAMPPFAVLLDHTLAVIWHVFNNEGAELSCLNKADICWALRFLESIDTSSLDVFTDLELLIEYLRKLLIARYALESEEDARIKSVNLYDSIHEPLNSSLALEEFMSSPEVIEDQKKSPLVTFKTSTQNAMKCSDDELLKRLKTLNPSIKAIDDVKTMTRAQPK